MIQTHPTPNHRDPTPDLIRGVAILIVTFFHALHTRRLPEGMVEKTVWKLNLLEPVSHGGLAVAIFVFLSGYCLNAYKSPFANPLPFLGKRFLRIAGPYFFAIVFWVGLAKNGYRFAARPTDWDIVSHLLFIHTLDARTFVTISAPLWYVGLIAQLYLIQAVLNPLLLRWRRPTTLAVLGLGIVLSILGDYWLRSDVQAPLHDMLIHSGPLTYLLPYVLGIAAASFSWSSLLERRAKPTLIALLASGPVLALWLLWNTPVLPAIWETEQHMRGAAFGLWILMWAPLLNRFATPLKPLIFLGSASYSVFLYNYAMHFFHGPARGASYLGFLMILSFLTVVFGLGMYVMIEKPYNAWCGKLLKGRKPKD